MSSDQLVLVAGSSATGKSASLRGIKDQEGVMYLGCEAGKKLPFRNKFKRITVTDPYTVLQAFDQANQMSDIHTIVVDSVTFLMDMFESKYIVGSTNTMQGWADYNQFFKTLMQDKVAATNKTVIILAHTLTTFNEADMVMETKVPVKGALKNNGVEAYFSTVVATKKVPVTRLKDYQNKYLTITPQEEALGFKHVYQCQLTKDTVNERIRAPWDMFETNETFIDNNAQYLLDILDSYYDESESA